MTSEKQKKANLKNSQLSTGPKTEIGKENSSKNSLIHGLTSEKSLMNPGIDNIEEFQSYTKKLQCQFAPKDDIEQFFVDRIISCMWRLKRVIKIEEVLFEDEMNREDEKTFSSKMFTYIENKMIVISRYEKGIENSLFKLMNMLNKISKN